MIESDLLRELQTAMAAAAGGSVVIFVYDLLRIFRRIISHGNVFVAIEDLFFWIWTTFWIFSVFYRLNDGEIRIYTICAMFTGMLVYYKVISRLFVNAASTLGLWIMKLFGFLLKPVKKLMRNSENKLKPAHKRSIMEVRECSEQERLRRKDVL